MHIRTIVKVGLLVISALVITIAAANWIVLHQLKENNLAQTNIVDIISTQEEMGNLIETLLNKQNLKPEAILYKFQDYKNELTDIGKEIHAVMQEDTLSFFITDLQNNKGVHRAINQLIKNQKELEKIFLSALELYKKQYITHQAIDFDQQKRQLQQRLYNILSDNKQIGFFIENIVENSLSKQIKDVYRLILILLFITIVAILYLGYRIYQEVGFSVDEIENRVSEGLNQIQALNEEIEQTQKEIILTMGSIAEKHDEETSFHLKRVAEYCYLLAKYYGLDNHQCQLIQQASPMHDIGKLAIPDTILDKNGPLDEAEKEIMKQHTVYGYRMLKHSKRELLQTAATIAYEHHEKWDGTGYPLGLKGEEIHIYGRITAIADVFDALGSHRPYKKKWDNEKIFAYMREHSGTHFDPALIEIFFDHIDEFVEIQERYKDKG